MTQAKLDDYLQRFRQNLPQNGCLARFCQKNGQLHDLQGKKSYRYKNSKQWQIVLDKVRKFSRLSLLRLIKYCTGHCMFC